MNGITHGLGVILCIIGFFMMSNKVRDEDLNKTIRFVSSEKLLMMKFLILLTAHTHSQNVSLYAFLLSLIKLRCLLSVTSCALH